jgi:succinate dehydrogenase/fumarate reductase iron-sulfur protein
MSQLRWNITFEIFRQKDGKAPHYQTYPLEVDPEEYVLDGIERIWAYQDRSLTYRHACHHSTCGACGMRINGVEKLTCITTIRSVTHNHGTIRVEPLRNFPIQSDLVVDVAPFFQRLEATGLSQVALLDEANLGYEKEVPAEDRKVNRLVDCIECGLCISACPGSLTSAGYQGPAVMAAAQHVYHQTHDPALIDLVDSEDGLWRCHSAFECSAVCPSNVDPAWRIMDMRKITTARRIRQFFSLRKKATRP